ncbi:MAG: hypothetical protein ACUVX9_09275 [Anaerolineae bacterium]
MNRRQSSGCVGCGAAGAVLAVVAVVLVLLALGHFGLMPGLSTLLGSDKPRDLGVRFTQADLESYHAKRQGRVVLMAPGAPPANSMSYAGSVDVRTSYTSEELTAVAAERAGQWAYWPIADWQIKIGQDGMVESSGVIRMDRALGYAAAMGFPQEAVQRAMGAIRTIAGNPTFYVRGTGSVTNNKLGLDIEEAQVGRLPVPANLISSNMGAITSAGEQILERSGVTIRSASFAGGQLHLDATQPQTRSFSPAP